MFDTTVAIVGGGIGGLACALGLQRIGVRVLVFEQDKLFNDRRQGYAFTIQQGNRALKELGILDQVKAKSFPCTSHFYFKSSGEIIAFFGRAFSPAQTERSRFNLQLPRQSLRQVLHDELLPGTVQWNKKLQSIRFVKNDEQLDNSQQQPQQPQPQEQPQQQASEVDIAKSVDGVELKFADGCTVRAKVVVGADGIYSKLATLILGKEQQKLLELRYSGVMVVLGIVPSLQYPLLTQRIFQTADGETRLYCMPYNDTHCMWQLSFPIPLEHAQRLSTDKAALVVELTERCGSWHDPIPQMIANTAVEMMMATPIMDRDPLPFPLLSERLPVTLVGDAAHPMCPFKGQGANRALLDGLLLSEHLSFSTLCRTRQTNFSVPSNESLDTKTLDTSQSEEKGVVFRIDQSSSNDNNVDSKTNTEGNSSSGSLGSHNGPQVVRVNLGKPPDRENQRKGKRRKLTTVNEALSAFELEMLGSTRESVLKSRQVVQKLHSAAELEVEVLGQRRCFMPGMPEMIRVLKGKRIGAYVECIGRFDELVGQVCTDVKSNLSANSG